MPVDILEGLGKSDTETAPDGGLPSASPTGGMDLLEGLGTSEDDSPYGYRPESAIPQQHPEISNWERIRLKNFAATIGPEVVDRELHQDGFDTAWGNDGKVRVRKQGDALWYYLDEPDTSWKDYTTDIGGDIAKLAGMTIGATLGLGGGSALPGAGTVGGAVAGAGLGEAGTQAGLNLVGRLAGVESGLGESASSIGRAGVEGAASELIGRGVVGGLKGAWKGTKGLYHLPGRIRTSAERAAGAANAAEEMSAAARQMSAAPLRERLAATEAHLRDLKAKGLGKRPKDLPLRTPDQEQAAEALRAAGLDKRPPVEPQAIPKPTFLKDLAKQDILKAKRKALLEEIARRKAGGEPQLPLGSAPLRENPRPPPVVERLRPYPWMPEGSVKPTSQVAGLYNPHIDEVEYTAYKEMMKEARREAHARQPAQYGGYWLQERLGGIDAKIAKIEERIDPHYPTPYAERVELAKLKGAKKALQEAINGRAGKGPPEGPEPPVKPPEPPAEPPVKPPEPPAEPPVKPPEPPIEPPAGPETPIEPSIPVSHGYPWKAALTRAGGKYYNLEEEAMHQLAKTRTPTGEQTPLVTEFVKRTPERGTGTKKVPGVFKRRHLRATLRPEFMTQGDMEAARVTGYLEKLPEDDLFQIAKDWQIADPEGLGREEVIRRLYEGDGTSPISLLPGAAKPPVSGAGRRYDPEKKSLAWVWSRHNIDPETGIEGLPGWRSIPLDRIETTTVMRKSPRPEGYVNKPGILVNPIRAEAKGAPVLGMEPSRYEMSARIGRVSDPLRSALGPKKGAYRPAVVIKKEGQLVDLGPGPISGAEAKGVKSPEPPVGSLRGIAEFVKKKPPIQPIKKTKFSDAYKRHLERIGGREGEAEAPRLEGPLEHEPPAKLKPKGKPKSKGRLKAKLSASEHKKLINDMIKAIRAGEEAPDAKSLGLSKTAYARALSLAEKGSSKLREAMYKGELTAVEAAKIAELFPGMKKFQKLILRAKRELGPREYRAFIKRAELAREAGATEGELKYFVESFFRNGGGPSSRTSGQAMIPTPADIADAIDRIKANPTIKTFRRVISNLYALIWIWGWQIPGAAMIKVVRYADIHSGIISSLLKRFGKKEGSAALKRIASDKATSVSTRRAMTRVAEKKQGSKAWRMSIGALVNELGFEKKKPNDA